jgi:endo-1,4-beta-mannosidase
MPRYRIKAYTRLERDYGYKGLYRHYYQDLQVKRWWGWQTLDTEEVPGWVNAYNAVGGASGWTSKFAYLGTWGRDGAITLKKEHS